MKKSIIAILILATVSPIFNTVTAGESDEPYWSEDPRKEAGHEEIFWEHVDSWELLGVRETVFECINNGVDPEECSFNYGGYLEVQENLFEEEESEEPWISLPWLF